MGYGKGKGGRHGGRQHQQIIDALRVGVLPLLRDAEYQDAWCSSWDALSARILGVKDIYPDVLFGCGQDVVIVEVGRFQLGTWPEDLPVIHVPFKGFVSRINFLGTDFESALVDSIKSVYVEGVIDGPLNVA